MQPRQAPSPERLTWAQIKDRYPDEFVVLVDIKWIDDNRSQFPFRDAVVLDHSKVRGEALRRSRPIDAGYFGFGHFWTGVIRGRFIYSHVTSAS